MSKKYVSKRILDITPKQSVGLFFDRVQKHRDIDRQYLQNLAINLVKFYNGDKDCQSYKNNELEELWYESLKNHNPDYTVYDSSVYISDLWACWICYSRNYLRQVRSHRNLFNQHLGKIRRIVDIGCGFGYTTSALSQLYPYASVYGTNLEGTTQFKVASEMGLQYGFKLTTDTLQITDKVDLVFASEYFEHFYEPIEHLKYVLGNTNPRCLVIANSFGTISVGHFIDYKVDGKLVPGSNTSKLFNKYLKQRGYVQLKTSMWNNKPSVWINKQEN